MKNLLFVIPILIVSCQNNKERSSAQSIVGKYAGMVKYPNNNKGIKYGLELELTESNNAVFNENFQIPPTEIVGTYNVDNNYIYFNGGNADNFRFKIIDNNTIRIISSSFQEVSNDTTITNILCTLYRETSPDTSKIKTLAEFQGLNKTSQLTPQPKILVKDLKVIPPKVVSVRRVIDTANMMWTDYQGDKEIDGGAIIDASLGEDTINGLSVICIIHGVKRYCIHGSGSE